MIAMLATIVLGEIWPKRDLAEIWPRSGRDSVWLNSTA
jgi:hypothetical protein